jgi:DNA-binding GntR family transcriptional regulator
VESEDGENGAMKKSILLLLSDEELQELYRMLIDRDAEAALRFLNQHLRKEVHQALAGGG